MAIKSNAGDLFGAFENLSLEIKDDASKAAMDEVNRESVKALEHFATIHGVKPSRVTGQDRLRTNNEQVKNTKYGGSIFNWKQATYETADVTGGLVGSPRLLGYRLWFIEGGTSRHSLWGKGSRGGFRPRPFYADAKKRIQKIGGRIIGKSIKKTIKKLTR